MKAYFLFTAVGPKVILTTYDFVKHPELLIKLESKGIDKFVAHEIPLDLVKDRYGQHFDIVTKDVHETDDMRVLDFSGVRAFNNFTFKELGPPIYHEPESST